MKMKFVMALFVAMITVSAVGQNNNRQDQTREYPSKEMISELNLTTDQTTALKEADTKYQTAMRDLRNQTDRSKMMDAVKKARTERLNDIKKALPDHAQYMSYLEYEVINPMQEMGMMGGNRQRNQGQRPRNNNTADFGGFDD